VAAPDRMEAPVVPTAAARMEARVLTEAIAEAEPVQSLPNAACCLGGVSFCDGVA
jgi:hypothetical protein